MPKIIYVEFYGKEFRFSAKYDEGDLISLTKNDFEDRLLRIMIANLEDRMTSLISDIENALAARTKEGV